MSENSYPLTPMQQGILYHSLLDADSGIYIQQREICLHETIDVASFKEAWRRFIAWSDVFRTRIHIADAEELHQEVVADAESEWMVKDWSQFSGEELQQQWHDYLGDDRRRGFDFSQPPLMRLALFRLGESDYRLLWTYHHVLLDGRSNLIAVRELFACYDALKNGSDYHFAECVPFGEFARWLSKRDHSAARNFWLNSLEGFENPVQLGVAAPAVQPQSYDDERGSVEVHLSKDETGTLRAFAAEQGLTVGTLMMASWAVLLGRYSGSEDVVFGVTRACRHASVPGSRSILGLLMNTVPLRIKIDANAPVLEWLQGIRSQWVAIRPYEHTPLADIQEWTGFSGDRPLFDSLLVYEDSSFEEQLRSLGGAWDKRDTELHERGDYPLVALGQGSSRLLLRLAYSRSDLEDKIVQQMLAHWRSLLLGLKAHSSTRVAELPMLSALEYKAAIEDCNDTGMKYESNSCIHQLIEEQVARTPDSNAVLGEEECLTYAQLNARANRLAHYLVKAGVGPEVRVALCLERTPELVIAVLAILKAGGAYVPLETDQPETRLREMLADSRASLLVTQTSLVEKFATPDAPIVCIDAECEAISCCSHGNPDSCVSPANLAYGLYTSGSTGEPKLIGIEHCSVVNVLRYTTQSLFSPDDLAVVPFAEAITFDPSVYRMFSVLSAGGSIVLLQSYFDLPRSRWADEITSLGGAPSLMMSLLADFSLPPSVRVVSTGAEIPGEALLNKLCQYPQLQRIYNFYGPTETTIYCSSAVLAERSTGGSRIDGMPLVRRGNGCNIGRPIWNVRAYILDKRMRPVPPGISGEICVGGVGVARGYLNNPALTAVQFVCDHFSSDPADRLYKTGDLGRFLPDGNIEFLGRMDSQIKIRGLRIEPQGIEAVLGENSAVSECVVRAVAGSAGTMHLIAYIAPGLTEEGAAHDKASSSEKELRLFLEARLPRWMVPQEFIFVDIMPRTIRGKIDFDSLPAPAFVTGKQDRSIVLPGNDLVEQLADVWKKVLRLQKISIHDELMALGGESLAAIRIINQVNEMFGIHLSIRTIFEAPTIAKLADRVVDDLLAE